MLLKSKILEGKDGGDLEWELNKFLENEVGELVSVQIIDVIKVLLIYKPK